MEARFDKLNATPSGLAQRVRFSGLSRTEVVVELVETQDFSPPNHAAKQHPEQVQIPSIFDGFKIQRLNFSLFLV